MSLVAFLAASGSGAALGLIAGPSTRAGRLACLLGLLVAFLAALTIGANTRLNTGEVSLLESQYARYFLACVAGSGLLLYLVALASGPPDELAPAALAWFAGLALALTAADPGVALAAAAAAATGSALVIVRTVPSASEADGRLAEIRTIGLVVGGLMFAAITVLRPAWTGRSDSPVFVVAFLALGLALAVRSGAVPFHVPAVHLHETAKPLAPALLLVWIPAGLGVLAISWSAIMFNTRSDWLNAAVAGLQAVAVATLVLGALAALVHDEIEEVAAYSIAADAGFVLLALSARTDAAAEPARLWLLVFVAAKTGLVAWAVAVKRAFGTSNVGRLRGWLRRTPLLGLALVVISIATLGWPGSAVYEARSTLIRLALPDQLQVLFAGSILLTVAYVGRLLVLGVLSPSEDVRAGLSERPRRGRRPPPEESPTPSESKPAAEPAAAVAAAVATDATAISDSAGGADDGAGAAPAVETTPASKAKKRPRVGFRRRLVIAWRLNRTLEVSAALVGGAALAVILASGGLGTTGAARGGIPLDTAAHATPTPTPTPEPTPEPTPTPQPTLAPHPTGGASGSIKPSGSVRSPSPAPAKTSVPAGDNLD